MFIHNSLAFNAYYSHGGEPQYPDSHWYPFLSDGGLGAEFNGGRMELWLRDDQRGDYDLAADGVVTHMAAPAINEHPQPWRNPRAREDVTADYFVEPLDVLVVINAEENQTGNFSREDEQTAKLALFARSRRKPPVFPAFGDCLEICLHSVIVWKSPSSGNLLPPFGSGRCISSSEKNRVTGEA